MHIDKKTLRNIFLGVISCILLYWVLHEPERLRSAYTFVSGILSPFFLGATLAFIINVPMRAVEKLLGKIASSSLRRVVALLLTFMGVLLLLALVFWLLIPQIISTIETFIPKLKTFANNAPAWITAFLEDNPDVLDVVNKLGLNFSELVQKAVSVISGWLTTLVSGTFSAIGDFTAALMDIVIAIVFSIYCLFQKETLARQGRKLLYAFVPEKASDYIVRVLRLTNVTFSNFLSGQCIEVCILGCMFAISMAIFQMPYIPLVSVLVAVTAFIPVVGAWVGCVLGTFFILIANPIQALWFVVMFLVLQQIENNLIYPRVVGTSIGLSGMWVLFAVALGGELMGAAGMFLMIPVVSVLYTLLQEHTRARLAGKNIDPDKLQAQPPEISRAKRKWDLKRPAKRKAGKQPDKQA